MNSPPSLNQILKKIKGRQELIKNPHILKEQCFNDIALHSIREGICFRPADCYISNKPLWFRKCTIVRVKKSVQPLTISPHTRDFEFTYYCDSKEYMLHLLKQ